MKRLPPRSKVKPADTWDLASLYESDTAWEAAFAKFEKEIAKYEKFEGTLGSSADGLAKLLKFDSGFERVGERLGNYAFLKTTEDQANSESQRMLGRFTNVSSKASQAASFIRPEILEIPAVKLKKFLADKALAPYRLMLERIVRYQPHTLGKAEENLIAMQSEMAGAAGKIFRQLTDADLKFGSVVDEHGQEVELSNATLSKFLHSPKRSVRKTAFHQFYAQYKGHENSLAAALQGSVQGDVYYAKARGYASAAAASLFHDNVPASVYDNLISAVRAKLPAVHRYLDVRKRRMKLKDAASLRYLRADPFRAGHAAHLGPSRESDYGGARPAWKRVLPSVGEGPQRPLV